MKNTNQLFQSLGFGKNKRNQLCENPKYENEKDTEKKPPSESEIPKNRSKPKKMNHRGKTKKNSGYLGKRMEKPQKCC